MRTIATLTQEQCEFFKKADMCRAAVKEIIHEAVVQYERSMLHNEWLWKAIKEKYGQELTMDEANRLTLNHDTGILSVMTEDEFSEKKTQKSNREAELLMKAFLAAGTK